GARRRRASRPGASCSGSRPTPRCYEERGLAGQGGAQRRLRHLDGARAPDLPQRGPPRGAGGARREAAARVQGTLMPMDLFEALSTTRAVRRFTDEPVSDADIMTCIRAATQAPSGGNIQPWQFLVVTDAATRRALGQVYRRAFDRFETDVLGARPSSVTPDAAE